MDTAAIFVTVGGLLLIAFNLWFFFGTSESVPQPTDGSPGKNSQEQPYACPMHPWITSDDPTANCSICGMKLVKRD